MCSGLRNATGIDFEEIAAYSKRARNAEKSTGSKAADNGAATMSIEENLVVVTPIDQRASQPIATTEQSMEDAPAWISRLADEQASILESKRVWEMDTGADALDALSRRNPRQRRAHFVEVTVRFQAS